MKRVYPESLDRVRDKLRRRGFTLIELLVAVTIIAIISAIGLAVFLDIQKGIRDARRKQDLRSIQSALEVYYQKNSRFPCTDPGGEGTWQKSSDADPWIRDLDCGATPVPFDSNYLSSLPKDPKNTTGFPWDANQYSYAYFSGDVSSIDGCPEGRAQYYILVTKLEKRDDPDRAALKPYYFCNGTDEIIGRAELIPGTDIEDLYFITSQD